MCSEDGIQGAPINRIKSLVEVELQGDGGPPFSAALQELGGKDEIVSDGSPFDESRL
jgi:hypothetical protein